MLTQVRARRDSTLAINRRRVAPAGSVATSAVVGARVASFAATGGPLLATPPVIMIIVVILVVIVVVLAIATALVCVWHSVVTY